MGLRRVTSSHVSASATEVPFKSYKPHSIYHTKLDQDAVGLELY